MSFLFWNQNDVWVQNTLICLFTLILAMGIEFYLIPQIWNISKQKVLFDLPDHRKSHANPIPRLGGISFLLIIMFSCLPVLIIMGEWMDRPDIAYEVSSISDYIFIMAGGTILLLIGIADDLVTVRASRKFAAQILASVFLVLTGNYFNNLHGLFGIDQIPAYIGIPITIFFVVYVINSFNLIDGVDGLAGSLAGLAALGLGILLILEDNCPYCVLAFAIVGVLAAFLYYNFSKKKKIFMGDTGSLTLGYLLAFLAVHYSMKTGHTSTASLSQPIVLAWSVMFIPLFDTLRVICIRLYKRKPIFSPDRCHIHHKMIDLGYSHKETTITLSICAVIIFLFNVILRQYETNINLILLLNFAAGILFNIDLSSSLKKIVQKQSVEEGSLSEPVNS